MSYQYYSGDRHGQSYNYASTSSTDHSAHRVYQSSSRPSDYISRPVYSRSDYISEPSQNKYDHPSAHGDYRSRTSSSDYIARRVESRSDCISPRTREEPSNSSTNSRYRASRQDPSPFSSASSFSSPTRYLASPPRPSLSYLPANTGTSSDRLGGKSNYQLFKEGGWDHQHDFMRSHGLKPWEHEDYQEAHDILDKYCEIDAHNTDGSEGRHYARDSSPGYDGDDSAYRDKAIDAHDSDIDSYHSDSGSDIVSQASSTVGSDIVSQAASAAGSDICSIPPTPRGSDYESVRASSSEDAASDGIQSGSDLDCSDEDNISDDDDRVSGDEEQGSVVGSDGDEGDVGDGEDYMDQGDDGYIEDDDDY